MTQQIGGYPPYPAPDAPDGQPTTQVARDEAAGVGQTAVDAGRHVAGTAAEQAGNVAQEVKTQARDLVGEARSQVQEQARGGQQKAAEGVRAVGRELREMADGGQQSGVASQIARQAADRADTLAAWLGEREPGDLLDEARSFARRRPGVFLAGMAVAGVVVGRLTRGAVDSARADAAPAPRNTLGPSYGTPPSPRPVPGLPAYDPLPVGPGSYDAPTPPRGYPATPAQDYPAEPYASPLPPATTGETFGRPTTPVGSDEEYDAVGERRTVGGYVDEVERSARERHATTEAYDDPYRPGTGELR